MLQSFDRICAEVRTSCRHRKLLHDEYSQKIGADTAENEPSMICYKGHNLHLYYLDSCLFAEASSLGSLATPFGIFNMLKSAKLCNIFKVTRRRNRLRWVFSVAHLSAKHKLVAHFSVKQSRSFRISLKARRASKKVSTARSCRGVFLVSSLHLACSRCRFRISLGLFSVIFLIASWVVLGRMDTLTYG